MLALITACRLDCRPCTIACATSWRTSPATPVKEPIAGPKGLDRKKKCSSNETLSPAFFSLQSMSRKFCTQLQQKLFSESLDSAARQLITHCASHDRSLQRVSAQNRNLYRLRLINTDTFYKNGLRAWWQRRCPWRRPWWIRW